MRYTAAIITYVAALLAAGPHAAIAAQPTSAGTCYTIGDPDARAYCLARAHRDVGRCYVIQKPDLRAMCRAEAGR